MSAAQMTGFCQLVNLGADLRHSSVLVLFSTSLTAEGEHATAACRLSARGGRDDGQCSGSNARCNVTAPVTSSGDAGSVASSAS